MRHTRLLCIVQLFMCNWKGGYHRIGVLVKIIRRKTLKIPLTYHGKTEVRKLGNHWTYHEMAEVMLQYWELSYGQWRYQEKEGRGIGFSLDPVHACLGVKAKSKMYFCLKLFKFEPVVEQQCFMLDQVECCDKKVIKNHAGLTQCLTGHLLLGIFFHQ